MDQEGGISKTTIILLVLGGLLLWDYIQQRKQPVKKVRFDETTQEYDDLDDLDESESKEHEDEDKDEGETTETKTEIKQMSFDFSLTTNNKCVEFPKGNPGMSKVQLWDCSGDQNQSWNYNNGVIKNNESGKCLELDKSDTWLKQYDCVDGNQRQQWEITTNGIKNIGTGKCVHVNDTNNGYEPHTGDCNILNKPLKVKKF